MTRILNISGFWIYFWFLGILRSEYVFVSEYARVLNITAWKVSVFGVILVRIFSYSHWIGVSLRIQSKCGKIRTRITPNTDTFYAVYAPSFHCVMVLNMGVSEFLDFVLHFSIVISCLLKRVVSYFNVYTKLEVIVWSKIRLLYRGCFSEETKLVFFIRSWKYLICSSV